MGHILVIPNWMYLALSIAFLKLVCNVAKKSEAENWYGCIRLMHETANLPLDLCSRYILASRK